MGMRNYRHIEVRPISGALGAELHGVDISRDLENDVVGEMRQALLDHLVIFLRDQKATPDGLIGVSSSIKADVTKTREDRIKAAGAEHKVLTAEHPIVRTHPETGRKALYTSRAHTAHIRGWTEK